MSYCVNCGVQLAESEKTCPLCGVEVINPLQPWKEPGYRPYSQRTEDVLDHIDRRYIGSLLNIFLLVPILITLATNLVYGGKISWSGYVVGAGFMVFVWFILPFYCKNYRPMLFLTLDCVAMLLFLLVIDLITNRKALWFFQLGLPLASAFSALFLITAYAFRHGSGRLLLVRIAAVLIDAAILSLVTEIAVDLYLQGAISLNWSPFVIIPCAVLAVATQIVERRKTLKEEIRKRIFY